MTQITTPIEKPKLNAGQQAAGEGFLGFLFSDDKEMIVSGPPGVGKTFWMMNMIDDIMPTYHNTCKLMGLPSVYNEVAMTATTNPATALLAAGTKRPTRTIYSFMNLKVTDDYNTGRSKVEPLRSWKVHEKKIIFVDECSMVDGALLNFIHSGTQDCKIVYVGDHCQLAPVGMKLSPVFTQGIPMFELTEPMRNAGQPALIEICKQLRETVETGVFKPIRIVPGVIDLLDDDTMQKGLKHFFPEQTSAARIMAYTNKRVIEYNEFIRDFRGHPIEYIKGDILVNNYAIRMPNRMLSIEEEIEILNQSSVTHFEEIDPTSDVKLEVRYTDIRSNMNGDVFKKVPLPVDRAHHAALIDYYRRKKAWPIYFNLRGEFPDLRPKDASTVYKAQGSSYDVAFVDLNDISTCRDPDQAARMLNVAFSRARSRVLLYGNLAQKYGGLIT